MSEATSKKAIVLLNMGGASSLDEIEIFLRNMFLDPLILRIPFRFIRLYIANKIIKKRLEASKANYRLIGGKSPLLEITKLLAQKVEKISDIKTVISMRYTPPFSQEAANTLINAKVEKVVLFSMYPQFSTTTTLSSFREFEKHYDQRAIKVVNFYKDIEYNSLVVAKIKEALSGKKSSDFALIFSAHGLPKSVIKSGDPYEKECQEHTEILKDLIREENLEFAQIDLAYQSRFGRGKWLEPSLEDKLKELANRGIKKVVIFPLSFTIDNLETVFELDIEYKEVAKKLGFEDYLVAKCVNDSDEFANFVAQKATQLLS